MSWFGVFIREPLVHFLAIGLGFFLVFNTVTEGDWQSPGSRTVIVDEQALLSFMQFRAKAFDAGRFKQRLASLSEDEKQRMIDGYIREEVLYREAKSLGMENDDYIIRRRLVQKLEFITRGLTSRLVEASEEDLEAFYQQRKDDYFIEAVITFTHVFFDAEKHGWEQAKQLAEDQMADFQQSNPSFNAAIQFGDRFPFHLNYVERSNSFIQSHFGKDFSQQLFQNQPVQQLWLGPYQSSYGFHLVLETRRTAGRYPELDEVLANISEDYRREKTRELQDQAIQGLIDSYDIKIVLSNEGAG